MRDLTLDEFKAFQACESVRTSWAQQMERDELFYRGEQPLQYIAPALAAEVGDHVKQLVMNLPMVIADSYENRLDVEGFRFPKAPSGDGDLWDIWQANNMDEQSQLGHMDAVSVGRAAIIVGDGDTASDPPVITVESATSVGWVRNVRTRKVSSAVKRWTDGEVERASLYLPGRSLWLTAGQSRNSWMVAGEQVHDQPIPVVPLVNKPRLSRPDGVSEFSPLIPIFEAINKVGSDMMVSAEYHAMPRRWVFGMKKSDFVDPKTGQPVSMWSRIAGRLWANENPEVKVGQFDESSLTNFHETVKLLVQMAAMIGALPPHYLSFVGDNPASADAIRSSESQLVKRTERKHTVLGGSWEDAARLALLRQRGSLPEGSRALETVWRDPATPTVAQKADAAVKLGTAKTPDGRAIIPTEQVRIDLGYTPAQRADMQRMDDAAARTAPVTPDPVAVPAA